MRERAKEHFPTVLLTLLSIVQALALELLWSHLRETDYLFEPSWTSVISWLQILATFLGLVLIWVVYADNEAFFRSYAPATLRDFYPQITIVSALVLAGIYLLVSSDRGLLAMLALLAVNCLLGWQFYTAASAARVSSSSGRDEGKYLIVEQDQNIRYTCVGRRSLQW